MSCSNILRSTLGTALVLACVFGCADSRKYPSLPTGEGKDRFVVDTRTITIESVTYTADFGTIAVPENRHNPLSREISIPFVRIHSRSVYPSDPVFALTGGPGNSNLSWDDAVVSSLLSDRDFVMVGYRGADGSSVLNCPEVKDAIAGNDTNDLLSEQSLQKIGRAWIAAGARFKSEGVDLDGYTIDECIEDQESVRRVLGYDRIDLLSKSYGTRVAYLYGLKHPEHIFRSAMIAVNPPGRFVWDPEIIDRQLRYYSSLWSKDSITSKKSNDLYKTMSNVLKNMPKRWLTISIDPGKVKVVSFVLLFHTNTSAKVFDAFVAAENGDASGLALMSVMYDYVMPSSITWGDLACKGVSVDFDSVRNYNLEMSPSEKHLLGSPMSKLLWGSMQYGHWPVSMLPEDFRTLKETDVETLIISGSIDFSTPAENATNELLPYLKKGRQIIFSEAGHSDDILRRNSHLSFPILKGFYTAGNADLPSPPYIPMNFDPGFGFTQIAKLVAAMIVLITVCAIAWLIRKLRKRSIALSER